MDFNLSEEQKMLSHMARDFLTTECPKKLVREMVEDEKGYSPELWRKMGELGWMGLLLPEEYGGTGGSFLDLAVLLEEMGRALLPGPFFSTVVLGGLTLLNMGNDQQKQDWLPRIARGELILTLALTEPAASYSLDNMTIRAIAEGNNYLISGTKLFVTDANVADYIICAAPTGQGISLFLSEAKSPGITITPLKTIAGDKQCEVVFRKVKVSPENIIGGPGQDGEGLAKVLRQAAIAKCAEMVGGAQQVFEMTLEYAKQRVQFGRPIGSFQVIQHYLTNMLMDLEGARFVTYEAAFKLSQGLPCVKEAAVAKTWASEAYRRITTTAQQIHGAIGFSAEYDLYLYFRRAKAAEVLLGSPDYHRELVAREIGL